MSRARFYVKVNGKEVSAHPVNGAVWGGTSGYIGEVNGYPVIEQVSVIIYGKDGPEHEFINAADVQESPVMVQEWFAPGATAKPRLFVFASREQVIKSGVKFTPND